MCDSKGEVVKTGVCYDLGPDPRLTFSATKKEGIPIEGL
jgi:hypothetical protein